jgi:hypothetical protein
MTLMNCAREILESQVELLEARLRETFPEGAFVLSSAAGAPGMLALTNWDWRHRNEAYHFPRALFAQGRPGELEIEIGKYIAAVRGEPGKTTHTQLAVPTPAPRAVE